MQSRISSIIENICNTGSGFLISYVLGALIIYPLFDVKISLMANFWVTVIFTVISILRGYAWRRLFNKKEVIKECKCCSS